MLSNRVLLTQAALQLTTANNTTCPNGVPWVWDILQECAQDGRDLASVYLGLISILCFMVSSLPWVSLQTLLLSCLHPLPPAQPVCCVLCVQAVLQLLQDRQHGQRHLHVVPAAVVGRRHLQPGGLLPGRPAPAAGERDVKLFSHNAIAWFGYNHESVKSLCYNAIV